jgi:hypothetical protein
MANTVSEAIPPGTQIDRARAEGMSRQSSNFQETIAPARSPALPPRVADGSARGGYGRGRGKRWQRLFVVARGFTASGKQPCQCDGQRGRQEHQQ